jgi:hypothetical protein
MSFDYWIIRSTKNNAILCEVRHGNLYSRPERVDLYWEFQDRKSDVRFCPALFKAGQYMPEGAMEVCALGMGKTFFSNSYLNRDFGGREEKFYIRRRFGEFEARNHALLLKNFYRGTADEDETISTEHCERTIWKALMDGWERFIDRPTVYDSRARFSF